MSSIFDQIIGKTEKDSKVEDTLPSVDLGKPVKEMDHEAILANLATEKVEKSVKSSNSYNPKNEEIVEHTFFGMLGEYYGSRYDFTLNNTFYVAYFDGETPTKLPKSVMEYLNKKLIRMDKARRLLPEEELISRETRSAL